MNKKHILLTILIIALSAILTTVIINNKVNTRTIKDDSGFDASMDSGSSSSSSSSSTSSSSHDSSNGSSSAKENPIEALIIVLLILLSPFIYILINRRKKKKELCSYGITDIEKLKKDLYDCYVKIQMALSKKDIESVKDLLADELYNEYQKQITKLNEKNEKNIICDFEYSGIVIRIVRDRNIFVNMGIKCRNYIINNDTKELPEKTKIRATKDRINKYLVNMKFKVKENKFVLEKADAEQENNDYYEMIHENLVLYGINDEEEFGKHLYDIYVKIQQAWSENNIDKARDVLSNGLYNQYRTQILTMITKNEQNIMCDFKYKYSSIVDVYEQDNNIIYEVKMQVECKDYIIDTIKNKVKRGKKHKTNYYLYKLVFKSNKVESIENCPNCNAKLTDSESTKCEYCGSEIVRDSTKIVLQTKKMISQR